MVNDVLPGAGTFGAFGDATWFDRNTHEAKALRVFQGKPRGLTFGSLWGSSPDLTTLEGRKQHDALVPVRHHRHERELPTVHLAASAGCGRLARSSGIERRQ